MACSCEFPDSYLNRQVHPCSHELLLRKVTKRWEVPLPLPSLCSPLGRRLLRCLIPCPCWMMAVRCVLLACLLACLLARLAAFWSVAWWLVCAFGCLLGGLLLVGRLSGRLLACLPAAWCAARLLAGSLAHALLTCYVKQCIRTCRCDGG